MSEREKETFKAFVGMPVLYVLPVGPCAGEARPGTVTRVYPRSHRVDVSAVIRADDLVYTGRSVVELSKARVLEELPDEKADEKTKAEPWVLVFRETHGRPAKSAREAAPPPPPPPPPPAVETDD